MTDRHPRGRCQRGHTDGEYLLEIATGVFERICRECFRNWATADLRTTNDEADS